MKYHIFELRVIGFVQEGQSLLYTQLSKPSLIAISILQKSWVRIQYLKP